MVGTICLDVAKAFDSINHDVLLYKMSKIGFNQRKSYLTRMQVVKSGSIISNETTIIAVIGQATILGRLLFIFYINDVVTVLQNLKINMYADDCMLYTPGNDWNRMILNVQPEVDNVYRWCTENRLKVSISKSKSYFLGQGIS